MHALFFVTTGFDVKIREDTLRFFNAFDKSFCDLEM